MQKAAVSSTSEDLGKLILRVVLAVLILMHGIAKITGGIDPIMGMVAKTGLPPALGYLAYVGEVVAPLLILFGIWTRPAALIVVIQMVVAVRLAHTSQLLDITKTGGWALELQAMYLFGALAVALLGAGRYSVGGATGKWN